MINDNATFDTTSRIVIITGPTAVGKSSVAVNIAKKINGEIISFDSMQIFRGLNIGTGKITQEEMQGIKHYLIDILEPNETFSVSQFVEQAKIYIQQIIQKGKTPILVGGTGLYINAFLNGHNFADTPPNNEIRNKYIQLAEKKGNEFLHDMLKNIDNLSAEKISINDTKRIIRALEIFEQTGIPKSQKAEFCKKTINYKMFVLNMDRLKLYERINVRVDKMFSAGLIEEVKKFLPYKNMQSMQAIGYKEVAEMLQNNSSKEDVIELVKQNSRHYAKRQLTYFKWMIADKIWIEDDFEKKILNCI